MKYQVTLKQTLSRGGVEHYEQYTSTGVEAEFETYEEAVAYCKEKLDALAEYVATYEEKNPMGSEYRPQDAFWNGGGDLRITPEPADRKELFNSSVYFYDKFGI